MKKLNRKGFTLVELLAVIIILAIVVGITIPAVLTTTNTAKEKAFKTAADTAADWFDRQYQVAKTGLDYAGVATLDENFKKDTGCGSNGSKCAVSGGKTFNATGTDANKDIFAAAGLKTTNVASMKVEINSSTGRTCVTLTAADKGDYYGVVDTNTMKSSNCR